MLEDKLSNLKDFVRNVKVKTVAYAVAATIALLPVYSCNDPECETDADCLENEVCGEFCYEYCPPKEGSYCSQKCEPSCEPGYPYDTDDDSAEGSMDSYSSQEIDPDPRTLEDSSNSEGLEAMSACPVHWCQTEPTGNVYTAIDVQVYIVRNSSSEGAVTDSRVWSDREALNEAFSAINVAFDSRYYRSFQFIDKPEWMDLDVDTEFNAVMNYLDHSADKGKGWPIVYVKTINGGKYGGLARMCNNEGIILAAGQPGQTAVHEYGHQFCLAHTHDTSCGVESCNGSNCGTAGDFVCDTKADLREAEGCTGSQCEDRTCGSCKPPVENVMSYHRCGDEFTPRQKEIMSCWLANFHN